jgi:hypothetical protein
MRDFTDGVEVRVGRGPRVLLSDTCSELEMLPYGLAEQRVVGEVTFVECFEVERDEAFAFAVGDLEVPVHVDDVLEAEFTREVIGSTERFGGEPGEMVDMVGKPLCE